MREAQLEEVGSGLAPVSDGWFVVNVRDAAWLTNDAFGARCVFEGGMPVLRSRPDLPAHKFAQLGFTLQVLRPGQPSGLYHAESNQEDFLVLSGECLLLVEGQERPLRAWDFVHSPAWTQHIFVGAGDEPCAILMVGSRSKDWKVRYPVSQLAARYGASAEEDTSDPDQAYVRFTMSRRERPSYWDGLP